MQAHDVALTTYACNVLADACIRCGQPSRALKLFKDVDHQQQQQQGYVYVHV